MRKTFILFSGLIVFSAILFSHEIWMFAENYHPTLNNPVNLFICSGHKFPQSSFLIRKDLIKDTYTINNGVKTEISFLNNKKAWEASLNLKKPGIYISVFSLVKRGKKEPFFWGRAIIDPAGSMEKNPEYSTGEGLEIIPMAPLSQWKNLNELKFRAVFNGKTVKFNGKVSVNGGKNIFLTSGESGSVALGKIKKGKYLMTTQFKGKGCSLTFELL